MFGDVLSLLSEFASAIRGNVLKRDNDFIKVIKDEVLLEYRFGSRYESPRFMFVLPFDLGKHHFTITKKKGSFETMMMLGYIKEIEGFTVTAITDESKPFLLDLFNDLNFKLALSMKLKEWEIMYRDQTLTFVLNKPVKSSLSGKIMVEELINTYELIQDFKKVCKKG